MILENNVYVKDETVQSRLTVLINQVYRLLPTREENGDWEKPLNTIIEEIEGMNLLFDGKQEELFFVILCKLKGLRLCNSFSVYRSCIFECLNLMGRLK